MSGLPWHQQLLRRNPLLVNVLISVAIFVATVVDPIVQRPFRARMPTPAEILLAAATCLPLIWRRYWPRPVLAMTTIGYLVYLTLGFDLEPLGVAVGVALYTVTVAGDRRSSLWIGAGMAALLFVVELVRTTASGRPELIAALAPVLLAVAIGEAVRAQRAYVAEVEERARHAEQTREEEAARRVVEERMRIARELHDVLAHHIALINVQAGVAGHVLADQPEQAREALRHVREASRSALAQLQATLGLLRQHDQPLDTVAPAPGLAQLDELLTSFRQAGLTVGSTVDGPMRPLSGGVDVTAYRLVQESLTNVRKHAGRALATVRIDYGPDALRIAVDDDGSGVPATVPAGAPGGHGITGMRERAVAVGGSLAAGPRPDGGFSVSAVLPYGDPTAEPESA